VPTLLLYVGPSYLASAGGFLRELHARGDVELGIDVGQVRLHRARGAEAPPAGGLLIKLTGKLSTTSVILALGPLAALLIIWFAFPETKGRELEDISGEAPLPIFGPPPVLGSEPLSLEQEPPHEIPPAPPVPSGDGTSQG
jgi:hypothetical protein